MTRKANLQDKNHEEQLQEWCIQIISRFCWQ